MSEEWRAVVGFEGYEVSDLGRVRSNRGKRKGYVLRPAVRKDGYRSMPLQKGGSVQVTMYMHRMVLEAFDGPPSAGQCCRHLDGDPSNNTPGNLRWGSWSENTRDMLRHGTHANANKTHCSRCGGDYFEAHGRRHCRPCTRSRANLKRRSD